MDWGKEITISSYIVKSLASQHVDPQPIINIAPIVAMASLCILFFLCLWAEERL